MGESFSKKPAALLREVWGHNSFRAIQEDVVNAVLDDHDVLALMPTGGGKSVCFQIPALLREGVCLVVTPLIALMKDQVEQLKKKGISAVAIFSGMSRREIDITLDNCVYGNIKFLYLSPERLKTEIFQERVKKMKVSLLVVDEAHCISQWGYDFRPAYLEISEIRQLMPGVNTIALTATATQKVEADIVEKLRFINPKVYRRSFARPNISYSVFCKQDKGSKLLTILHKVQGPAIVYVRSRKRTGQIAQWLTRQGISAAFYHGGLSNEIRTAIQDKWIRNQVRVIVATNAFGMGIDKPDVRAVVHMDLPDSLEAYYQEAGRAGRDEKKAYAVVLCHQQDIEDLRQQPERQYPGAEQLRKVYQSLANYYKIAVGSSFMASYDFLIDDFCQAFGLKPPDTYYAIKRLEEEGFIQFSETFHYPSKIHIPVDNRQLYAFRIANESLDGIIKTLLRVYGGELFTGFIKVSEKKLSGLANMPVKDVERKLDTLHQMEIILYDRQKSHPQLTFTTPRQDAITLPVDSQRLKLRKENYACKVEKMTDYAALEDHCRSQFIQRYFSEVSPVACGVCDICLRNNRKERDGFAADT